MEIVYLPFLAFIALPPVALVPAVLFGAWLRRHPRPPTGSGRGWIVAGAVCWLLYAIYESAVWVWSRDVVAPIRVDLLLIAPGLYLVTFLGARACRQARKRAPAAGPGPAGT